MAVDRKTSATRRAENKKKEQKQKVKSKAYAKNDAKRPPRKKGPNKSSSYESITAENSDSIYTTSSENKTQTGETQEPARGNDKMEKAYKLLAMQEGISNSQAKTLIDRGRVYANNRKVMVARGELKVDTRFTVENIEKPKIIFENNDIIVVDKPAFLNADEVERQYPNANLLHRLDRETSGVLMLVKNEAFRQEAIRAFKNDEVYKEYVAWVEGMVIDPMDIDKPILTEKRHNKAHSKISKLGKPARTELFPLEVVSKRSKVKLIIHSGRTHQIRCHLRSVDHPIVGDEMYGGRRSTRVMLHAKKVTLLGMTFESPEPKIFTHFSMS